jgi:hypothetical protein
MHFIIQTAPVVLGRLPSGITIFAMEGESIYHQSTNGNDNCRQKNAHNVEGYLTNVYNQLPSWQPDRCPSQMRLPSHSDSWCVLRAPPSVRSGREKRSSALSIRQPK